MSAIKEVSNPNGIPKEKLIHIFLGTVKDSCDEEGNPIKVVSGYHCDYKHGTIGDELVYVDSYLYLSSNKQMITANRGQKLFEAIVKDKATQTSKEQRSSFFRADWSRQDVVDCIARLKDTKSLNNLYPKLNKNKRFATKLRVDPRTGMVVVDIPAATFPLLKY